MDPTGQKNHFCTGLFEKLHDKFDGQHASNLFEMYKIRCLNKLGQSIHNIYYIKWCPSDFVHQWYQHDLQSLLEGRDRFRITRCHSQGWKIPGCQSKKFLVQTYIANMVPSPLREKR